MNRIDEISNKINQEILKLEAVKEYKKYESLIQNNQYLKDMQKELHDLQKLIVLKKSKQDDTVQETIDLYLEKKNTFENHPLIVNYQYLQEEVDEILQSINSEINSQLSI